MTVREIEGMRLLSVSRLRLTFVALGILMAVGITAQEVADYSQKNEYEIGEVTIVGANYSDENAIMRLTNSRAIPSFLRLSVRLKSKATVIPSSVATCHPGTSSDVIRKSSSSRE